MLLETSIDFNFHPFFEMTPDLVCLASKEGYFKKFNQAVINKLGYSEEELLSQPIASFIHPDDKALTARERTGLLNGTPLKNFQNRYITKSGMEVWLEWTSLYIPEQEMVFAIAKDVTINKLKEKEIEAKYEQFKSLAGHFKKRSERDRKYIAVELHEELAQLAAVVKMEIDWIKANEPNLTEQGKQKAEHAATISQLLINAMRRISFSISPAMLHDLGLAETLQWHCKEFARVSGITCSFSGYCNEAQISYETKLDIFRICQEALHNVLYHAEANYASLQIEETDQILSFYITDNGKGFDQSKTEKAQGLMNMQSLATSIGGNLFIKSDVGKGTQVIFQLKK